MMMMMMVIMVMMMMMMMIAVMIAVNLWSVHFPVNDMLTVHKLP